MKARAARYAMSLTDRQREYPLVPALPHPDHQRPPDHEDNTVVPPHVRRRGPRVRQLEAPQQVREQQGHLRVGEVRGDAHPGAFGEGHEFAVWIARVGGGGGEPARGLEGLRGGEGGGVLVVDVAGG